MRLVSFSTINTFCSCLLAGTILLGLVWLVMLALRQPASRVFVARCGLLCLPFVLLLAGLEVTPKFEVVEPTARAFRLLFSWIDPGRFDAPAIDRGSERGLAPGSTLNTSPSSLVIQGLSIAYAVCVGVGLLRLALGWSCGRLLCVRGTIPPASIVEMARSLSNNRPKCPRIRVSTRLDRPMLVGVFEPTILLPFVALERGSEQEIRSILRHEISHLEMSDPLFTFFGQGLSVFAFPVVPLGWILAQSRLDQEYLADARTVRALGDPAVYASTLLSFSWRSKSVSLSREVFSAPTQMLRSTLSLRILMLLRPRFPLEFRASRSWIMACLTILPAAGLVAASLQAKPAAAIVSAREGQPSPTAAPSRTFKINSLLVSRREGDSTLLELPSLAGRRVIIEGTVLADPATLADLEILDLPLRDLSALTGTDNQSHLPESHTFRIEISEGQASVSIDQFPASHYRLATDPERLSFRVSGNQSATLLNVRVSW